MKSPFFTTAHGVLYDADCLKILQGMRSGVIDTVFADPPFNIGKNYKNGYDDKVDHLKYLDWCRSWIEECCRILKPGGAFFLYATPELAVQFAPIMGEQLQFRHWIALTMKGTYPRGNKLYPAHYALLYYTLGSPRVFNKVRLPIEICRHCGKEIRDYGGHRNKMNPEGVNLTDFWTDTSPNRHKKFKARPGVNELKLIIPERAILISTDPDDIVLDPFGGGGSTFQAAEKHHRNWIGTELYDSQHIRNRLNENFALSANKPPQFDFEALFLDETKQDKILRRVKRKGVQTRSSTHILELQELLIATEVKILDEKQANGAGHIRELIDKKFSEYPEWVQSKSGDIDWVKRFRYNQTIMSRLGVEIQVSGRSDLLARDIVHIRNNLQDSHIDVGVIVVPSDDFEYRLTDRVANYSYAVRYVEKELREAQNYPIVLIAVEHDGYSVNAIPKKTTNLGKAKHKKTP